MKKRYVTKLLCMMTAAAMTLSAPAAAWAEETTETAAEETTEETTEETEEEKEVSDFVITLDEKEMTVKNESETVVEKAELKERKADKDAKEEKEDKKDKEELGFDLVLTEEDGTVHTFENADVENWTEPSLVSFFDFLYVVYKDASGAEQEVFETADEYDFEKPVTMYASTSVHIRKEADKESESLKVTQLGDEYQATGAAPGWFHVKSGDIEGYAYYTYFTEDKAAVDALIKKQQEEKAAQEAAAAAAAQAAAEQAAAQAAAEQAAAQAAADQAASGTAAVSSKNRSKPSGL